MLLVLNPLGHLANAEVSQDVASAAVLGQGHQDVGRLDVAVQDVLAMGFRQGGPHLDQQRADFLGG